LRGGLMVVGTSSALHLITEKPKGLRT